MSNINVAIVGFGLSAKVFHLPFVNAVDGYSLQAIVSSQQQAILEQYPECQAYPTLTELLAGANIDLVIITSPNDSHYKLAKTALNAACHVVVEKPFTVSSEQAEELIALAASQQRQLTVYHNRRLDGDFLTVKKVIEQNRLGNLRRVASCFDRFRPDVRDKWKEHPGPGNGALYDLGSHLIDQSLQLFGWPQAVSGRCLTLREHSQTTDYFQITLHYPELEVQLGSSPFNAGKNHRFNLQGDKGSLNIYGLDNQEEQLAQGVAVTALGNDTERLATLSTVAGDEEMALQQGNYLAFYQQLLLALQQQHAPPVSADSAWQVIKVIEAAIKASDSGNTIYVS
ncbi:Gfo/Idh/MocA family oxidoreductase [Thalassotalea sp. Y01]|uniref:Gfo/Idh/MocA family oxidoreductase n=1 Tax=Thalassotalea sp. Y01 TaxID=2729613 RepID=UPI00145C5C36|nr:Gfo/Idh/MocA family oxidoreductase [Thalassotalea sp. Y01]NMP16242.1 Gfo/Idh/MocA family oxidoreductase [Thalassotalea sp. Y01]